MNEDNYFLKIITLVTILKSAGLRPYKNPDFGRFFADFDENWHFFGEKVVGGSGESENGGMGVIF